MGKIKVYDSTIEFKGKAVARITVGNLKPGEAPTDDFRLRDEFLQALYSDGLTPETKQAITDKARSKAQANAITLEELDEIMVEITA